MNDKEKTLANALAKIHQRIVNVSSRLTIPFFF